MICHLIFGEFDLSYPGHCNSCGAIFGNIKSHCLNCGTLTDNNEISSDNVQETINKPISKVGQEEMNRRNKIFEQYIKEGSKNIVD